MSSSSWFLNALTREGLTRKQEASSLLTEDELVSNINILLSTGHETTTHLIGNGLLALLQHPDQLKKLRTQHALLASAIEEMLRYDNPVQITYRSAVDDAEIKGKQIRKGDLVNTIIASANRDPQRFTNPDDFNITRSEGRHLGFGIGIHFCIGAPLVRLEAEVVFETILRRFPGICLTGNSRMAGAPCLSRSEIIAGSIINFPWTATLALGVLFGVRRSKLLDSIFILAIPSESVPL